MDRMIRVTSLLNQLEEVNRNQQSVDIVPFRNLVNIGRIQRRIRRLPTIGSEAPCPEILELLQFTHGYEFSNKRDRIYALLGMTENLGFKPDYNLTVEETYVEFSKWVINSSTALYLLSYARGISDPDSHIPSWSPSPYMDDLPKSLLHVAHFNASLYAGHRAPGARQPVCTSGELRLKGKIIDSVERKGETWCNAASTETKRRCLNQCADIAQIQHDSLSGDRFCRAMTLNVGEDWTTAPPEQSEWFRSYFTAIVGREAQGSRDGAEEDNKVPALLTTWARRRYFCRTYKHRFAWVPTQARVGDDICIIENARIPYVIHPVSNGSYELVGECWVEGLMEGEALGSTKFKWKDISLV
ncbi:hypothetical protein EG327_000079 [Venturia inaequalis]|uniref:Uncharacterized protein n=2 Tax=Venturia inaequalis TaxID=5025 RepID=A0A8H3VTR4_VENIN|nr:hypothetical protein EG327_000079 [Venturia inaequalis]